MRSVPTCPQDRSKHLIVTLVHGTWGQNSPFLAPESLLRTVLRDRVDATIEFVVFRWSGKNSISSRLKAGRELATLLHRNFINQPTEAHALICHSHGGNVAMYALRMLGYVT